MTSRNNAEDDPGEEENSCPERQQNNQNDPPVDALPMDDNLQQIHDSDIDVETISLPQVENLNNASPSSSSVYPEIQPDAPYVPRPMSEHPEVQRISQMIVARILAQMPSRSTVRPDNPIKKKKFVPLILRRARLPPSSADELSLSNSTQAPLFNFVSTPPEETVSTTVNVDSTTPNPVSQYDLSNEYLPTSVNNPTSRSGRMLPETSRRPGFPPTPYCLSDDIGRLRFIKRRPKRKRENKTSVSSGYPTWRDENVTQVSPNNVDELMPIEAEINDEINVSSVMSFTEKMDLFMRDVEIFGCLHSADDSTTEYETE